MERPRASTHYPKSLGEFQAWFPTDADCLDYLEWLRWPCGFVCPSCGELLPGVHRIASLAKRWLLGTHQGAVDSAHLPSYLDEFVFRFNRRRSRSRGMLFYRVLELAVAHGPVRYQDLVMSQSPKAVPPKPPRQRGHPPSLERPSPGRPWRQIPNSG